MREIGTAEARSPSTCGYNFDTSSCPCGFCDELALQMDFVCPITREFPWIDVSRDTFASLFS